MGTWQALPGVTATAHPLPPKGFKYQLNVILSCGSVYIISMKHVHSFLVFGLALCVLTIQAPMAQERTSNNAAMDPQLDWSALSAQVTAASNETDTINARVDNILTCNRKAMLYVPGTTSDGCVTNSKIDLLNSRADAINKQISSTLVSIPIINGNINSAQNRLTAIQGTLNTLSPQVNDLLGQYNDLANKAASTISTINSLYTSINAISAQISSLTNQFATHTAQIADLYTKIAAINASIGSFNSSLAAANNTINSLNSTVSALNSNTANVLSCGTGGYVFNRNSGCAVAVSHASCSFSCPTCLSLSCY